MSVIRHVHHRAKRHFDLYYRARYAAKAHLIFVIDSILVLAVLALLGLGTYFAYYYHPLRDDFRIEVLADPSPRAGEETEIDVRIINDGRRTLTDATLVVHFPSQFILLDGSGERSFNRGIVELGLLPAKASAQYRFKGLLIGPASEERVYAHFAAKTEDGGADEKLASGALAWRENLIEARFGLETGGMIFIAGQELQQSLDVHNRSSVELKGTKAVPTWPEGFRIRRATPPARRDGSFFIGDLAPDAKATLEFLGRFTAPQPAAPFSVDIIATVEGREMTVARAETKPSEALDPGLRVTASFDTASASASPGETVPVIFTIVNMGDKALKHLAASVSLHAAVMDAPGDIDVEEEDAPELAELAPGARIRLNIPVKLKSRVDRTTTNASLTIRPYVSFRFEHTEGERGGFVTGAPVTLKIDGSVALRAVARYFTVEGDQVGRGPLPPRVGKQTTYWISASAETTSSPIRDGRLIISLPPQVRWTGRATPSVGDIPPALDANGRLVWSLPQAEAWGGFVSPLAGVTFEVALIPTNDQIGSPATLLNWASFEATDAWTGTLLKAETGPLTTSLPYDDSVRERTDVRP